MRRAAAQEPTVTLLLTSYSPSVWGQAIPVTVFMQHQTVRANSEVPHNFALQRTHSRVTLLAGKAQASRHAARR